MRKAAYLTVAIALTATAAEAPPKWHYSRDIPICDKAHLAFDQHDLAYCMDVPTLKGVYVTPTH